MWVELTEAIDDLNKCTGRGQRLWLVLIRADDIVGIDKHWCQSVVLDSTRSVEQHKAVLR